ncbi:MAG TPA: hypothetical protein VFJ16_04555 [Longimicrobium sp.]|nr:hypothetical protein [Longimicrobium sp.]
MRMLHALSLLALVALLPRGARAQRYAAPVGARDAADTTVAFGTGDEIVVTSYPRMAGGVELCGTVGGGMQWGKMMFAHSDADRGAQEVVVSFPTASVTPQCQTYRPTRGEWLVVSFARPVRDEVGRIGRIGVGELVLPLAPLMGKRVTFRWQREGAFNVRSVAPVLDTLGPPRP